MTPSRQAPTAPRLPRDRTGTAAGHSRRAFLRGGAAAAAGVTLGHVALHPTVAADAPAPATGEEALARLLEGNTRFAAGQPQRPDQSRDRRMTVAAGQHPFA